MSDVKQWLKRGDPLEVDPQMPSLDAQRMRRVVVNAAATAPPVRPFKWLGPVLMAGALAACVILGVRVATRLHPAQETVAHEQATPPAAGGGRRQLSFATPGGTRIIWTFNKDWEL
jgi:hypothetical protein